MNCQNSLLNYFVAGVRQMLNLVNQNKQHLWKQTAILHVMAIRKKLYF